MKIPSKLFPLVVHLFLGALVAMALFTLPGKAHAAPTEGVQRVFASPEEGRQALLDAVKGSDRETLAAIFGPALKDLEPDDPVERGAEFKHFAQHLSEGTELYKDSDSKATLLIGAKKWPFPIPIVKVEKGWIFDTKAGHEEIVTRRIGHNELMAINVCRAYVEAQREYYAMAEPDGDQLPKYAQHMISRGGTHNGLYWPTAGEKESPLGPLVAKAKEEGYPLPVKPGEKARHPFHGYYFRILKSQGKNAPGGKFNYVINGNMVAGFALVAYPAKWGSSGVMTFIVNQRGRVYQKNLGLKSAEIARKMTQYNPDLSWKLTEQ